MSLERVDILGVHVNAVCLREVVDCLLQAAREQTHGYVCVTGAHGVVESQRDAVLKRIHNDSFVTIPDGAPLSWIGRLKGHRGMTRVYGPDLMLAILERSAVGGTAGGQHSHFLCGATEGTLDRLEARLRKNYPGIIITGRYAPPFWTDLNAPPLSPKHEEKLRGMLARNPPDFLWVGLSTPKQEKFMSLYSPTANGVPPPNDPLPCNLMLGVGAAFDILSGSKKDAPTWVKKAGMQWFYRLCQEPRRLWRRYCTIVPHFLFLAALQLLGLKRFGPDSTT